MLISLKGVNYIYSPGTPFEIRALEDINLDIDKGEFLSIIGHTGSGKSTLIQHLNGLMLPSSGEIYIGGQALGDKKEELARIRQKIGLVFQYPEHQLFEETVLKDISFGALNLGYSKEETLDRARRAMAAVGLDFETYKDLSPMELSGGEKRRVAIAGVLIMEPEVLVLDEPTAGLDPRGREEILAEIKSIHEDLGLTVVLVSHSMDDVARLVQRIIVMDQGRIIMDGPPLDVFKEEERLVEIGLGIPQITSLMKALKNRGLDVDTDIIRVDRAHEEILRVLGGKKHA